MLFAGVVCTPTPELSPSSPGLTTAQTPVPYHRTDCMTATAPQPRGGGGLSSSLTHLQVRAMLLWSAVTQTPGEETTCVTTQRQGGPRGSELSQSRVLSWSLLSLCTRPLPLCAGKAKGQPDRHLCSLPTPVTSGSDVVMAALSQGRWGHPSHTRAEGCRDLGARPGSSKDQCWEPRTHGSITVPSHSHTHPSDLL